MECKHCKDPIEMHGGLVFVGKPERVAAMDAEHCPTSPTGYHEPVTDEETYPHLGQYVWGDPYSGDSAASKPLVEAMIASALENELIGRDAQYVRAPDGQVFEVDLYAKLRCAHRRRIDKGAPDFEVCRDCGHPIKEGK